MRRTTSLILVLALAAAGTALAQGPGFGPGRGHRGHGMGRGGDCLLQALDLTDEQQAAVTQLRDQHLAEVQPLHEQVQQLHQQIRTLLDSGNATAEQVGELMLQANTVRSQLQAARETFEAAVRALLTPEQQVRFDELREQRGRRHGPDGEGDGPGPGMGPGFGCGQGHGPGR